MGEAHPFRQIVLRSAVLFHIAAIVSWSLPKPPDHLKIGLARHTTEEAFRSFSAYLLYWNEIYLKPLLFEDYLRMTGFQQNWNMFAPEPIRSDYWVEGRVRFGNGRETRFVFPRNVELSLWQQILQERFNKYLDTAQQETSGIVWPSMADYIARKVYEREGEVPVSVELIRHSRTVALPGEEQPNEYESFKFFETPILKERIFLPS